MKRLAILAPLALAFLAACQDLNQLEAPVYQISDGEHGGNPHLYFLPPLVPSPSYSGVFDASLLPYLRVDVTGPWATDTVVSPLGTVISTEEAASCSESLVPGLDLTSGLGVNAGAETYSTRWRTGRAPVPQAGMAYRLCVIATTGGSDFELGYRDVMPDDGGANQARKTAQEPIYQFGSGSNLPIKFRVEEGALSAELCVEDPANPDYDCTAEILMDNDTAVCDNATCSLTTPDGGLEEPTLFLIERVACTVGGDGYTDWLAVDIPQYGGCMRVTVFDPTWEGFLNDQLAIVATCPDLSTGPPLVTPAQDESMQLHMQRSVGDVVALPPRFSAIDGECVDPNPETALGPDASFGERLAWAVKRGWRHIRGATRPAAAYAFHTGFGGHTRLAPTDDGGRLMASDASLAQTGPVPSFDVIPGVGVEFRLAWAIPSQMEKVTPLTHVVGVINEIVPVQVLVTDNGRTSNTNAGPPRPVRGATVHFGVVQPGGLVVPGEVVTDGNGVATVDWTLQPGGELQLDASGFGIGVRPASGFGGFDALGNTETPLETGVLTFTATVLDGVTITFDTDPDGNPVAPGSIVNDLYAPFGVEFVKVPNGTECDDTGDVFANDHGPSGFGSGQNNVSLCPAGTESDFGIEGTGAIKVVFEHPASIVCIDVWPGSATARGVLEVLDANLSLTFATSTAGATETLCASATGIQSARFYGDFGGSTVFFDNLRVEFDN